MPSPTVSVILPAYKRRYLSEAIASVLDQSFRDFELVVVDDCSPEKLKEIVDSFTDDRIRYCRNPENIGGYDLCQAWNVTLREARGEWVVCAGDDDVYHPDFLQEMLALAARYPDLDAFHCRIAYIDGDGAVIGIGKPRFELENQLEMVYHSCVNRLDQRIGDFMYRRSALLAAGGYQPSPSAWYSDIMTAVALTGAKGAACSPRILFKWRQSGTNISSRTDDVPVKIAAGLLFKTWIWRVIDGLQADSDDDRMILAEIRNKVDSGIYTSMRYYWQQLPLKQALSVLANSGLPEDIKTAWRTARLAEEGGVMRKLRRLARRFLPYG